MALGEVQKEKLVGEKLILQSQNPSEWLKRTSTIF